MIAARFDDVSKKDIDRFMSYVHVDPNIGDWLWTGGISSTGYGVFWYKGKTVGAHALPLLSKTPRVRQPTGKRASTMKKPATRANRAPVIISPMISHFLES